MDITTKKTHIITSKMNIVTNKMKKNVTMVNTRTIVWTWSRQWGLRLMKVMWLEEKVNAIKTQGKTTTRWRQPN